MVLQLLVGVPLEMVHGATRIGLVYVAGVVAGRLVGPAVLFPRVGRRRSLGWYEPGFPGISKVPDSGLSSRQISRRHQTGRCVPVAVEAWGKSLGPFGPLKLVDRATESLPPVVWRPHM